MTSPKNKNQDLTCDVLIVGSGAAAMVAANLAHDRKLSVIVVEKSAQYGGTSAISGGGIWIPNHPDISHKDSPEQALTYLRACTEGKVSDERLRAFIESAPDMLAYVRKLGVPYEHIDYYPDYYGHLPGATIGRTLLPAKMVDGSILGDDFMRLRDQQPHDFKLFGRVSMLAFDAGALALRMPKWRRTFCKALWRYWSDLPWRFKTTRDRMVTNGNAMMVMLRKGLLERRIPLYLNTRFSDLVLEGERVVGALVERNNETIRVHAKRGVVLATGGFERNQHLRSQHLPSPTSAEWSGTVPAPNNVGDILGPVQRAGAVLEFMNEAWWAPVIKYRTRNTPNIDQRFLLFFQRAWPHSICVNREGRRFTNEAVNYHVFGMNMLENQKKTGANLPCWMIFDAEYRKKYPLGVMMPSSVWPDWTLPKEWFGDIVFRADTIDELAKQIAMDPQQLESTVRQFNQHAAQGKDPVFGRGDSEYDKFSGDPFQRPNPSLGTVAKAPFYAVRIDLGDLGTKGGPRVDENGLVLRQDNSPIEGLYAVGNCASPMSGGSYPGAGATLGPAMTFAFRAALDIALREPNGIRHDRVAAL